MNVHADDVEEDEKEEHTETIRHPTESHSLSAFKEPKDTKHVTDIPAPAKAHTSQRRVQSKPFDLSKEEKTHKEEKPVVKHAEKKHIKWGAAEKKETEKK